MCNPLRWTIELGREFPPKPTLFFFVDFDCDAPLQSAVWSQQGQGDSRTIRYDKVDDTRDSRDRNPTRVGNSYVMVGVEATRLKCSEMSVSLRSARLRNENEDTRIRRTAGGTKYYISKTHRDDPANADSARIQVSS